MYIYIYGGVCENRTSALLEQPSAVANSCTLSAHKAPACSRRIYIYIYIKYIYIERERRSEGVMCGSHQRLVAADFGGREPVHLERAHGRVEQAGEVQRGSGLSRLSLNEVRSLLVEL